MTKELILYYAYNGSIERHAAKNHDTISSLARRWHVDPDTLKHAMSGKPVCARTARKIQALVLAENPCDTNIFYPRARSRVAGNE